MPRAYLHLSAQIGVFAVEPVLARRGEDVVGNQRFHGFSGCTTLAGMKIISLGPTSTVLPSS